jgi:hypothetical protein
MFVRCCSWNCSSVFFSVFKLGSHLYCVANIVVRIFEIPRTIFVGHLSISVQIDLNCKDEEVLSNYEVIYVLCFSHGSMFAPLILVWRQRLCKLSYAKPMVGPSPLSTFEAPAE